MPFWREVFSYTEAQFPPKCLPTKLDVCRVFFNKTRDLGHEVDTAARETAMLLVDHWYSQGRRPIKWINVSKQILALYKTYYKLFKSSSRKRGPTFEKNLSALQVDLAKVMDISSADTSPLVRAEKRKAANDAYGSSSRRRVALANKSASADESGESCVWCDI
ncbi:uncharacterized protein LOC127750087 [Frankliniella occidentalis]|uniref:Uncharacterized protein LOC127750087 n=1 Tax=Frankliniella occidentalis TaxID=133901 RepID=A0A9C6WSJ8_FRAOC|nr:uncharacterized protein LOC127750087 [Frankliniella occidentalis]